MSNLLKMGSTNLQDSQKRMIDMNELVARRIEELSKKMVQPENAGFFEGETVPEGAEGDFFSGLSFEAVDGLLGEGNFGDGLSGNVIKSGTSEGDKEFEKEQLLAETKGAADAFLEDARAKAKQESEELLAQARAQIEAEREAALASAREQGYQEGFKKGEGEFNARKKDLAQQEKALRAEYEELVAGLEPDLVDAIGGAYEHLIGVELSAQRNILLHMVSAAMRNIEGGREFVVHISPEDYPYVSMEKKQLEAALSSPSATLELVEDVALEHNSCIIETEGGIFDCGLGTQLTELRRRLKLLSYEK